MESKVHYRYHKRTPLGTIFSHENPVLKLQPVSNIHINIIQPPPLKLNRLYLRKLTVTQLVIEIPAFKEPEGS